MKFEWEIKSISEIVNFNPSYTIKKGTVIPYVEMAAVPEYSREIAYFDEREFTSGSKFKNGDTLFSRITPCLQNGKTARASGLGKDQIANGSTEFIVMSAIDYENDKDFVYYLSLDKEFRKYAEGRMEGSTGRQRVSWQALAEYELPIPPKDIRKKIAHILSTLDDKIELNRKMNQTLEEMASAIFKSWFVDFDPVHARLTCKDEAELENIAKELGISKAILDLFPSEFEESEFGMIPKGWENTELSQISKIQSGYAFKSAWWQDTGVKVIKIKNIDGNRVNTLDCECVSEEIATKNSNFKLSSGDLLIAMTGATVGKVGVIYTADEEYLLNQRVGRFQPIKYYDEYVKIFASSSKFFESIQGQAQGSAQPNISAREIESVKIVKPNDEIMKTFSSLLNPFFSKILEHQGEIQTLQKTRDTLLPKLLSGEIDVSGLCIGTADNE